MRCFACFSVLGIAGAFVLGCGASHSVDYFSGGGGSPAVTEGNTGGSAKAGASVVASAGQSAASNDSVGSSSSVGGSGESGGSIDASGAPSSVAGSSAGESSRAGSSSGGGAPSNGACAPVADIGSGMSFASVGPVCLRVALDIAGWGCSNFDGRTLQVNGTTVTCGQV
ncbi:MAG TPA: hypothetical protein VHW01_14915, partial [Polyangiaceae bacterium]|nr:hypothetical protein [Polyangiaceae bacterium]